MATSERPFSLKGNRYDLNTYWGRCRHFYDLTDPRTLFVTRKQLDESLALLKAYEQAELQKQIQNQQQQQIEQIQRKFSDAELWEAKKIRDAVMHPDLGEMIPAPFRFSAFSVTNIVLCAGLLWPNPSTTTAVFWQWLNQSYNVCTNYANRNASNEMSVTQLGVAYVAAVTTSCSLAVGLGSFMKKYGNSAKSKFWGAVTRCTVPFIAVVSASIVNLFLIRQKEFLGGVDVRAARAPRSVQIGGQDEEEEEEGEVLGKSILAARRSLQECSLSRIVWNIPILVVGPAIMSFLSRFALFGSFPIRFVTELGVMGTILLTTVPPSLALFPQTRTVPVTELESQFHHLKRADGTPIEYVNFNKGL